MKTTHFDPEKRIYGILYAMVTAVLWGFLAIMIKVAVVQIDPVTLVWFRFLTAFIFLFTWFLIKDPGKLRIFFKPPIILIIASLGLIINYIGYAKGIDYTTPGTAQVFIQLGPILLAVAGVVIFKERLSIRQAFGFLVAGIGFIVFYNEQLAQILQGENIFYRGIIWLITGSLTWNVYSIFQKKLVQMYQPQQLNLIIYFIPVIVLLPFIHLQSFSGLGMGNWVLLVVLGLNTLIAYGTLAEAFKYVEANKVSIIITLNPIITFGTITILAALQVDWVDVESISVIGFAGAVLVIIGAILVILPKRLRKS